jgi:hypothetical protein
MVSRGRVASAARTSAELAAELADVMADVWLPHWLPCCCRSQLVVADGLLTSVEAQPRHPYEELVWT